MYQTRNARPETLNLKQQKNLVERLGGEVLRFGSLHEIPESVFRFSGFGFQDWGLCVRVFGFMFSVSRFVFREWAFVFVVSSFGFRNLSFGVRVSVPGAWRGVRLRM